VRTGESNSYLTVRRSDPITASDVYRTLLETGRKEDAGKLESHSEHLVKLLNIYGKKPFTRLSDARSQLGLERGEFTSVLEMAASTPVLRLAVTDDVAGRYWTDTILPLEAKGVFDAALENKPTYPSVVGLYPGPTCMFRCHFCIRVTGAKYGSDNLMPGTGSLIDIIDEAPVDDPNRFYISGGLEPLTNPNIGKLATHASLKGFNIMLYTNLFALTEQTLKRQPGIWNLGAIRTSLYGLSDEEYQQTVGKSRAFSRVQNNLVQILRMRDKEESNLRLGISYLILPGRVRRLDSLLSFLRDIRDASGGTGIDFVSLRQDYSNRPDGKLRHSERHELIERLGAFDEVVSAEFPSLYVDYGYALSSMLLGQDAQLPHIAVSEMRPTAHPQVSVQVDLLGDVYLYREAGFPGLEGAKRYVCGRVGKDTGLGKVVETFVRERHEIQPRDGDQYFLDGFDQVVTARLNQLSDDLADGWGEYRGFLR